MTVRLGELDQFHISKNRQPDNSGIVGMPAHGPDEGTSIRATFRKGESLTVPSISDLRRLGRSLSNFHQRFRENLGREVDFFFIHDQRGTQANGAFACSQ